MPKVLVDAWHLGGASANRGIGTYLREVLPRLAAEPDLDVVALVSATTPLPGGVARAAVRRIAPNRFARREHELRLPFDLARAAASTSADVVFSPADDPPARSPRPWVQMLHDVIPLVVDDPAFAGDARRWHRIAPRLRDATVVVTNSRCTARDAEELLGIDRERIVVAPLGVSPRFAPAPASARRARDDHVPTVLYVGEYGPHKGFGEAFEVIGRLAALGLPHRLAMVGHLAPWHEPAVHELLARAPRPERVDLLGYVDDVVAAYRRADAVVVTSRYEGFCLPALEAMACGTPVIAFDNSAITEVVAGGGTLVADGDIDAFVAALQTVLTGDDEWQRASARGVERAREFTWERCAHAHAEALRRAVAPRATSPRTR